MSASRVASVFTRSFSFPARLATLLLAFSVLPFVVAVVVAHQRSSQTVVRATEERLRTLATLKRDELGALLEAQTRLAHRAFGQVSRCELARLSSRDRNSGWRRCLAGIAGGTGGADLVLLDSTGMVVAATQPGDIGRDWSGAPGLDRGRERTEIVGPHHHPELEAPVLGAVYVPVRSTDRELVAELAVIGGAVSLERWLRRDLPADLRADIVDPQGRRLVKASDPVARGANVEVHERIAGGGSLVLRVPRRTAIGPLEAFPSAAALAALLLGLLAVAAAIVLGRRWSRPVFELAAAARRIGQGNLQPLAPTRRRDEIGLLWGTIEEMRVELSATRARSDQVLAGRTTSLLQHQLLLRSVFEVVPDVVIIVGRDRRIQAASQTATSFFDPGLPGRSCYEAMYGLYAPCPDCPLDGVLAGCPCRDLERTRVNRSGEVIVFDLVAIARGTTAAESAVYSGRVVTRERVLQQRLVHQEKMAAIGNLAAAVAHDIGNPLASLSSLVQLRLRRSTELREQADLRLFLEHLERIDRTVKSLTRAAREPGRPRQRVFLQDVVERALRLVSYDPRAQGVTLKSHLDPAVPGLLLDEDAWLNALLNLLVNALDAVADTVERRVEVSVGRARGGTVLVVRDTGCGMTADAARRALDPLFTTKPPGRGTGLGLTVVREVAESHGGSVSIESAPAQGTTVCLELLECAADEPRAGVG